MRRQLREQAEADGQEHRQLEATLQRLEIQLQEVATHQIDLEKHLSQIEEQRLHALDEVEARGERIQLLEQELTAARSAASQQCQKPRGRRPLTNTLLPLGAAVVGLSAGLSWQALLQHRAFSPGISRSSVTPGQQLLVQADQPSWLEVRTPAGRVLYVGELTGQKRFPLRDGLQVLAGRPDRVTVTTGQGPPRPLGSIEEVGWKSFAPADSQ
ncbi:hypothetical protein [Vulcanococcus limneticus]|uniref:hypothetical protein n=1 Tax=Vulcanococcus limneticus TaxID=2170428 RepID=UPI000B981E76